MNHCKRRGSIESSCKITVAGAVAFQFAGRRAIDEDVPDIKRVEAITFSPRNRKQQPGNRRNNSSRETGSTATAHTPAGNSDRQILTRCQQPVLPVDLAPIARGQGLSGRPERTNRQNELYPSGYMYASTTVIACRRNQQDAPLCRLLNDFAQVGFGLSSARLLPGADVENADASFQSKSNGARQVQLGHGT